MSTFLDKSELGTKVTYTNHADVFFMSYRSMLAKERSGMENVLTLGCEGRPD